MGTAQWGLLLCWSFTMFSTLERAGDGGGHKGGGGTKGLARGQHTARLRPMLHSYASRL